MESRDSTDRLITRRTALRAGVGAVAAGIGVRPVVAQSGLDQWFGGGTGGETKNYDGVVDETGSDTVTVEVGAQGNGGPYAFAPAAVRIDPGTTVKFTWVSDTHNIMIEEQPSGAGWEGHQPIENQGFEYEHTFETEGIYKYYCQPHRALGMKGAIVVGGSGGGGSGGGGSGGGGSGGGTVGEPDYGGWFTGQTGGETTAYESTVDRRGNDTVTVEVGAQGNGGPYAFGPTAVRVDPGTTVKFTWVSDTHNIMIEEQPSGAGWEGHQPIENQGFEYEHTFETEGIYKYYCQPHRALGMKGAIVVGDIGGGGGGGGGTPAGGEAPAPPTGPTLAVQVIGAGIGAVLLALFGTAAYVFANYESYTTTAAGAARRAAGLEPGEVREESVFEQGIVRDIGHHDFDPSGTATLIVVYFVILVLMWVFMYFVEFLGGGPTVIG
ncbi:MAG: halocyanin domain-containing protein [Haloferacaceae archaeon]